MIESGVIEVVALGLKYLKRVEIGVGGSCMMGYDGGDDGG